MQPKQEIYTQTAWEGVAVRKGKTWGREGEALQDERRYTNSKNTGASLAPNWKEDGRRTEWC
jgi:hypothetical protein